MNYWEARCRALEAVLEQRDEMEVEYRNEIAPMHCDLPTIMTMATPDERAVLMDRARELSVGNKWNGTFSGPQTQNYPSGKNARLLLVTDRARQQTIDGNKKPRAYIVGNQTTKHKKPRKNASRSLNAHSVTFMALHVLLIADGRYPTEARNQASHLCHKGDCLDIQHVIWESANDNQRRDRLCRKTRKCICCLQPPCNFSLH